jgi:hypothetical protein
MKIEQYPEIAEVCFSSLDSINDKTINLQFEQRNHKSYVVCLKGHLVYDTHDHCDKKECRIVTVIGHKPNEIEIENAFFFIDSHPEDEGLYHHEDNGHLGSTGSPTAGFCRRWNVLHWSAKRQTQKGIPFSLLRY